MCKAIEEARAHIQNLLAVILAHHQDRGSREIVDMQEFASGRARAPDRHLWRAAHFGFVKPAQQRGQHVRSARVEA